MIKLGASLDGADARLYAGEDLGDEAVAPANRPTNSALRVSRHTPRNLITRRMSHLERT